MASAAADELPPLRLAAVGLEAERAGVLRPGANLLHGAVQERPPMSPHILDDDWTGMREDDGRLAPVPDRRRNGRALDTPDSPVCQTSAAPPTAEVYDDPSDPVIDAGRLVSVGPASYDDRQIGAVLKACAVCGQMRHFVNHDSDVCGACRT